MAVSQVQTVLQLLACRTISNEPGLNPRSPVSSQYVSTGYAWRLCSRQVMILQLGRGQCVGFCLVPIEVLK